ncbi:hypothetical protein CAPTEDRAFT_105759 [Capitella teleta]|uniref:Transducer of regulated CREB activity N-terminal domain-containing protein n=1 Tax=Capitella teleta TaxID=283909 RepID=R7VKP6_CAPTE|nr:hypothetical protein CAPTEDRAFT_105759 [Capitella teleta]|eukprot:ELU16940.1 hypothetical protein CAPTEDRAFT_105759 [Capitella teleta]
MANPRKFSEKIALQQQKQAEETAAFEAILREVNASTKVYWEWLRWPSLHAVLACVLSAVTVNCEYLLRNDHLCHQNDN